MKRGWILSLGWLIWAGCVALLLPARMRALETGLNDTVRQHLTQAGFTNVDIAMDGQSVEVRWRGDALAPGDADGLHNTLTRAAEAAESAQPDDWPFAPTGDWSGWATAPVITAVADQASVPDLPPLPPIVATESDPRAETALISASAQPAVSSSVSASSSFAPPPVAAATSASVSASAIAATACTGKVTAAMSGRRLHFVSSSAQLTSDSDAVLDDVYKVVHGCAAGLSLEIDGYTDNIGPARANLTLSFERARAAAAALVKRGLPQEMVNAHGFGPENPVTDNTSEAGRAANRRVVFVLRPA